MNQLSKGQEQFLIQLHKEMSKKFVEPGYKNFRLIYTTNPEQADVTISKHHTVLDYMAIGFVALAKEPSSENPVIVAMHETSKETALYCQVYIGSEVRPLHRNSLMGVYKHIDSVVARHLSYPGFAPFGVGLALPSHFACLHLDYIENPDINLEFEDFNDVLAAQKLAFSNLKAFTISTYLGSLESYMTGE